MEVEKENLSKAQLAQRERWARTNKEERQRLGSLHSAVMQEYHKKRTPEERKALAVHAARVRWGRREKKEPPVGNSE